MQTYSYKSPGCPSHISKGRTCAGRHAVKLTRRHPVRCSLTPHVISRTVAAATLYCAAMTGLVRTFALAESLDQAARQHSSPEAGKSG